MFTRFRVFFTDQSVKAFRALPAGIYQKAVPERTAFLNILIELYSRRRQSVISVYRDRVNFLNMICCSVIIRMM